MSSRWEGTMEQPTSEDGTGDAGSRYRPRTIHVLQHENNDWFNEWTLRNSQTLISKKQSSAFFSVPCWTDKTRQTAIAWKTPFDMASTNLPRAKTRHALDDAVVL